MNIVHVMNWYIPGMGYQENFLPAEQKKLGHDVTIITSDRFPAYSGFNAHIGKMLGSRIIGPGIFYDNGIPIHRLRTMLEVGNGGQVLLKGLKRTITQLNPQVIHAHNAFSPATIQTVFHSKRYSYPIFIDDHSNQDNFILNSVAKKMWISFVKLFYRYFGSYVLCWFPVTFASEQNLKEQFRIHAKKMHLLPLGFDSERFYPSDQFRRIGREELGIEKEDIVFISSGKFDPRKEVELLIDSFDEVRNAYQAVKLVLLGNGPEYYMEKLRTMVKNKNLSKQVIFADFVKNSELPKYYNASDVGVWPGTATISVIEALGTGLPVIIPVSDQSYRLLIENHVVSGFSKSQEGDLSKQMDLLAGSAMLRDNLRTKASNFALTELSWKRIASDSIAIYQNYLTTEKE